MQCWVDDGIASGESLQVRFFGQYSIYLFFFDLQAFVSTFIFTLTTIRPIKKSIHKKDIYIYIYMSCHPYYIVTCPIKFILI